MADTLTINTVHTHGAQRSAEVVVTFFDGAGLTATIEAAGQPVLLQSFYCTLLTGSSAGPPAGLPAATDFIEFRLRDADNQTVIPRSKFIPAQESSFMREWPVPGKRLNGLVVVVYGGMVTPTAYNFEIHYQNLFEGVPQP